MPKSVPTNISEEEKELLKLLSDLLQSETPDAHSSNVPPGHLVLTEEESRKLQRLIKAITQKKSFLDAAFFVEKLGQNKSGEKGVRKLFLNSRIKRGKSNLMGSLRWHEFKVRIGIATANYTAGLISMKTFLRMELQLFSALKIPLALAQKLVDFVSKQKNALERIIQGRKKIRTGSIKKLFLDLQRLAAKDTPIPTKKIYAATTVLSNMTTLFTTRDWGAVGTLSSMAGTAAVLFAPDDKDKG